jgi:hypothetical protein
MHSIMVCTPKPIIAGTALTDIYPKVEMRSLPRSLADCKKRERSISGAIQAAYASGVYLCPKIGDYFGLHLTTNDKIARHARVFLTETGWV